MNYRVFCFLKLLYWMTTRDSGTPSTLSILVARHLLTVQFVADYHKFECGRRHIFGKIMENAKKAGGKNKIGSTLDFSKLCFRVNYSDISNCDLKSSSPGHCQVPRLLVQRQPPVLV